jgi:hypothetical protein
MPTIPWPTFVSTENCRLTFTRRPEDKDCLALPSRARGRGWLGGLDVDRNAVGVGRPSEDREHSRPLLERRRIQFLADRFGFCGIRRRWIPIAAVAYCIWQLFGGYLRGRIFTGDAAAWVQRIGIAGLTVVAVSIVTRRIGWLILTSHSGLPFGTRLFTQFVVPNDLLGVLFSLFVLAVGHVFKVAVQIADDNASIV